METIEHIRAQLAAAQSEVGRLTKELHTRNGELKQVCADGDELHFQLATLRRERDEAFKDKERLDAALLAARQALVSCGEHYGEGPPNTDQDVAALDSARAKQGEGRP